MAAKGFDAAVPSCAGWTVRDAVAHVAEVYLHKAETMRRQADPQPWPPPGLSGREPIALLLETRAQLLDELRTRGPEAPSYTWHPPDQTVGFWFRRMALETAVHRIDVELAHAAETPVDALLAADGIDEVLTVMLAGDWSDFPVEEAAGTVVDLSAGTRTWRIQLEPAYVTVTDHAADPAITDDADVVLSGDPSDLLLWLWGRAPLDRLTIEGAADVVTALRSRVVIATQ
ncbi:maleylpyruvate isomerase family mycothiol-dependent enzyme [Flindersiella endophytica]